MPLDLPALLRETGALLSGHFRLSSGLHSPGYVQCALLLEHPRNARAIGEAVMLAMVSGSVGFAPNPADGLTFVFEPSRPLAPPIVQNIDQLSSPPANATLFAIAAVLLFSAAFFSFAGWFARRSMRKYGTA